MLDSSDLKSNPLQLEACGLYFALTRTASVSDVADPSGELSLGGKLLYAGELDPHSRALVIAGNIAGCATIAATADNSTQKQAIRDGVVDFLVNSLDEALRILKNEIRQRKTVAVCVGVDPDAVEREMIERGVQPDLVFAGGRDQERAVARFGEGARQIRLSQPDPSLTFLTWQVEQTPARWMPVLEKVALSCVVPHSWEGRWIRLSSRYLGRSAFAERTLLCDQNVAREIIRRFSESVQKGEICAEVKASIVSGDETAVFKMQPGGPDLRSRF